jgi:crotonobetainyl-CoA:carnitine CoA-transferase CaiB-like acyl-CoA transferase
MKKEEFYKEKKETSIGPLDGIRVLEATTSGAGPWAGTLLADMGAEVLKIDQPETGDLLRRLPPFLKSDTPLETGLFHLSINRNKKNITLKLSSEEGAGIFKRLVPHMDIIIENFKAGTMDKWGVGYNAIKQINPTIIYTSISGFGQYGPLHTRAGYDGVGQAMGGLMNITGYPDRPPAKTGNAMADNITGWLGAFVSVCALYYRKNTGEGQQCDVNLLDSILYTSEVGIIGAANANYHLKRIGHHPLTFRSVYKCKDDRYVYLMALLDKHWKKFCQLISREDLIDDPRTNNATVRLQNKKTCEEAIEAWVKDKTMEEVISLLGAEGLVCAPVLEYAEIVKNEHVIAREMVAETEHPIAGKINIYGVAPKLSKTPGNVRLPAPLLGQHNEETYLGKLNMNREEFDRYKASGVI